MIMISLALAVFALLTPVFAGQTWHQEILVGRDGGLTFWPETINAKPGEKIKFTFVSKTHSVTQSSFDYPCQEWYGGQASKQREAPSEFIVDVKDDKPMYFYCGVADHCSKGMVFSINSKHHHNRFKWKAMNTGKHAPPEPTKGGSWGGQKKKKDHYVTVGGPKGNIYDPPTVHAEPGEKVIFKFLPKNHTVTQSSFEHPCTKLNTGFASGFTRATQNGFHPDPFVVEVKDKNPIYGYCGQTGHCAQGMVFIINPSPHKSFHAFQQKAKNTGSS